VGEMLQRAEMVRRIAEEIDGYVVELGRDGRLVQLQLEEYTAGVEEELRLICKDYLVDADAEALAAATERLADLDDESLLDLRMVVGPLGVPDELDLESAMQPRGHRLLARIPRLAEEVAERIVERFSSLPRVMRASIADLTGVEGVGESRARAVKDGLARLAETSILERYA